MKLLKNREVLFQTSITETLLILLFFLLFISSISRDKVVEQEDIIKLKDEEIEQQKDIIEKVEGIDDVGRIVEEHSDYYYNNVVLNEFLDSLADGDRIEDITEKTIEENASLKEKIDQYENLALNDKELMDKNEKLKEKEKELKEKEEDVEALMSLMANRMKAGDSDGDLDPNEEIEQEKELLKAEKEKEKLEEEKKQLENELQDREKELAELQKDQPSKDTEQLNKENKQLQNELAELAELLRDTEEDNKNLKTKNAMGINAPACGFRNSPGMDNPYLFQLDFSVQCLPKKDKKGNYIPGTKDCESNPVENKYFLMVDMKHSDKSWLTSKSPAILEGKPFYELEYSDTARSVGGQGTKTNFTYNSLSSLMNRLNDIKISRFLNQNTQFCQDWRNQNKGFCRECTYNAYFGKVDEEVMIYVPEIQSIISNYVTIKTDRINDPKRWIR
jgi:myosin heavy subunit